IKLLKNQHVSIERGGAKVTIAGVDDVYTKSGDVDRTLEGAPHPVVALAHDPKLFARLAERDVALTLSGRTHWGQVGVPFLAERLALELRERAEVASDRLVDELRDEIEILVRAARRLGHDLVDDLQREEIGRRDLELLRGLFGARAVFPEDRGAALGRDDRVA